MDILIFEDIFSVFSDHVPKNKYATSHL